jgi:ATP-dependent Lhr-like helicase
LDPNLILSVLTTTDPEILESLIRVILKNSSSLRWELVKVARKFGVISKEMDLQHFSPDKLLDIFADEPMVEEVVDRVVWEKMDVFHAQQVLQDIQQSAIQVHVQSMSPMSRAAEATRGEVFRPMGVDETILATLKKRLEKTPLTLRCLNCEYEWGTTVGRAEPECPRCSGRMIAVAIGREGNTRAAGAAKTASLVATYGHAAFLVLAGYGIGPDTAARVLGTQKEGSHLLQEILSAEITYSRTRQFWD